MAPTPSSVTAPPPGRAPGPDGLEVRPERGRADRRRFLALPYRLYRDHPVWVPPLRLAERALTDRRRNPFFRHARAEHFLAWRAGRVVGRIAAIDNPRHNEVHGERVGFFGFFDVEPDPAAARALVAAAGAWCRAQGLTALRGPVNYSTNDSCGVLVEGFEDRPLLLMPYNRPDYEALLLGAGLAPVKDLVTYWIPNPHPIPPRFARVVDRRAERAGLRLRPIDLRRMSEEAALLKDLYNRCWERNWGFVPATDAEFDHAAKDLARLVDTRLSCIAECAGRPVGFSVFLHDLNELLHGTRGRLLPTLWWRLLTGLRRVRRGRCILLGVVPEARGLAINEAFFVHALRAGRDAGIVGVEAGWILEENQAMRKPLEAIGAWVNKRYRIYEAPLGPAAPPPPL